MRVQLHQAYAFQGLQGCGEKKKKQCVDVLINSICLEMLREEDHDHRLQFMTLSWIS